MNAYNRLRWLLLPVSGLYGLAIWLRNSLFNMEVLPSERFDVPLISIGNITVGGTGKTPMTEYLATLLGKDLQVAVLSRGYKRKSKGFLLVGTESVVEEVGDESIQIKKKFPDLIVAVDENRRRGIHQLSEKYMSPKVEVILLDDAFQHRYVEPGISILLIDYNRLITSDFLLPAGNLREPASQYKRAHILVFTKCPRDIKPIDMRLISKKFKTYSHQTIYYTTLDYSPLKRIDACFQKPASFVTESEEVTNNPTPPLESDTLTMEQILEKRLPVLIVVGIASPAPFVNYVRTYCPNAQTMLFSDHHTFSNKEIHYMKTRFETIRNSGGVILTTEKDSIRMSANPQFETLSHSIYYPGIQVRFLDEQGSIFDKKILDYVRINKRNRGMGNAADAQ